MSKSTPWVSSPSGAPLNPSTYSLRGLSGNFAGVSATFSGAISTSLFGQAVQASGAVTLPTGLNSSHAGKALCIYAAAVSAVTITVGNTSTDFIYSYSGPNGYSTSLRSITLYPGDSALLMSRGGTEWDLWAGSIGLADASAYQRRAPALGYIRQLRGWADGASKVAAFTAYELIAKQSPGGKVILGSNLSLTFTGSNVGANGMDTGAMPASGNLYIYAIYNPSALAWACLGTISGSGAPIYPGLNMPSGYLHSILIWAGKTAPNGNLVAFKQADDKISLKNVSVILQSNTITSWSATSVASVAPPCTKSIDGLIYAGGATASALVTSSLASDALGADIKTFTSCAPSNILMSAPFCDLYLYTAQTVYCNITSSAGNPYSSGFGITAYRIN